MSENDLVKGIFFKTPHNNAPDFVKRKVNIKVDEFIEYLQSKKNEAGYVNFDLLESKSGHWYFKYDDWKPDSTYQGNSSNSGSTWGNQDKPKPPTEGGFKPGSGFKPLILDDPDNIPF